MVLKLQLEPRRMPFVHPIHLRVKTAVFVPVFRSSELAPVFLDGWGPEIEAFEPEAIAASKAQLAAIAAAGCVGELAHGVVRIARPGERWLTEAERESLWDAFRAPVFEQVVDRSGAVLAQECEAHDGLHIESMVFSRELAAKGYYIENEKCGCGRPALRLRQPRREERFGRAAYRQLLRLNNEVEHSCAPEEPAAPAATPILTPGSVVWKRHPAANEVFPGVFQMQPA